MTYVMSCFELPKQLCQVIHQLMARFWWGAKGEEKKIHWLAWEKLCVPKDEGDLGFQNLVCFNNSLLAKQGWRLIKNPNSLAARFFKAQYFPHTDFMKAPIMSGMSFAWRSILVGREVLAKGLRFQIGSGELVSLWNDPWLPLPYNFKPLSLPMEGTEAWRVGDLIDHESKEWIGSVASELFTNRETELILGIPMSLKPSIDREVWHFDKKGLYTVKSGYHALRISSRLHSHASTSGGSSLGGRNLWGVNWKARIPPKNKLFIWRLARCALAKRVSLPDIQCVFYHNKAESEEKKHRKE